MKTLISTDIVIDNQIVVWGSIEIEFTGDEITEEITKVGVKAMLEHLLSYRNEVYNGKES